MITIDLRKCLLCQEKWSIKLWLDLIQSVKNQPDTGQCSYNQLGNREGCYYQEQYGFRVNLSNMPSVRSKVMVTGNIRPFEQTMYSDPLWRLHINHIKQRYQDWFWTIASVFMGLRKVRSTLFWSKNTFLLLIYNILFIVHILTLFSSSS